MIKTSVQKPKHVNDPKSTGKCFSKFMILLYALLIGWIGLLVFFHLESGVVEEGEPDIDTAKQPEAITTNNNPPNTILHKDAEAFVDRPPRDSQSIKNDLDQMHIVFSTDCSFFQDWQTLVVFHSAIHAKQPGDITRIASGCSEERQTELKALYATLYPQYHVHFTPDYKMDNKTKKKYDFYNKPYGLHHWLKYADPPIASGVVVILIDPDMIILRPFTLDIANNPTNLFLGQGPPVDMPKRIGKGSPAAQIYGLGAPWASDRSKHFNRTDICGPDSPCLQVTTRFGEQHFR